MSITITRKEACELIRTYVGTGETPKGEDLDKIVFAVNNDYSVRDFMLGLPEYYDVQEIVNFMSHMSNEAPVIKDVPFIVVNAALAYENNQMKDFFSNVGYAATMRPDYSLNKLLMRIASVGWPGEALAKMRSELAAKVMGVCYTETPNHIIVQLEDPDKNDEPTQTTNV